MDNRERGFNLTQTQTVSYAGYRNHKPAGSKNLITNVIFNYPATIVFWCDGTKTVVKCTDEDFFDPMVGLAMAICKRYLGNDYKRTFKKWMPVEEPEDESFSSVVEKILTLAATGISIPKSPFKGDNENG